MKAHVVIKSLNRSVVALAAVAVAATLSTPGRLRAEDAGNSDESQLVTIGYVTRDNRFFAIMALFCLGVVFTGFARTYYLAGLFKAPLPNLLVHVHGAVFSLWILLFATQTSLVAVRRPHLHRRLGMFGFLMACLMVILGGLVATDRLARHAANPGIATVEEVRAFYAIPLADILMFSTFVCLGFYKRSHPAVHKRLMMFATLALLDAGFDRWSIFDPYPLSVVNAICFLPLLAVLMAYDWWSTGKVQHATIWASCFMVTVQQLRHPLGHTAIWQAFATWAARGSGMKWTLLVFRLFILFAVLSTGAHAQWLNFRTPGIPRTPDGKANLSAPVPRTSDGKPDLSGVWMHEPNVSVEEAKRLLGAALGDPKAANDSIDNGIAFQVPGQEFSLYHRYGVDVLIDFTPEESPLRPEAAEVMHQRAANRNPASPCPPLPRYTFPTLGLYGGAIKIIQSPRVTALLYEVENLHRQIFTDGRILPKEFDLPAFLGYSAGHWERDDLVVETAGFNDKTALDTMGHPHSEALRVTERFHRENFGHMEVEMTFDDPKMYTKPFRSKSATTCLPTLTSSKCSATKTRRTACTCQSGRFPARPTNGQSVHSARPTALAPWLQVVLAFGRTLRRAPTHPEDTRQRRIDSLAQ